MSARQATQDPSTGQVEITGRLDADRVPDLLTNTRDWLANAGNTLRVDLGHIEHADSAGVAFLLEIQRRAQKANKSAEFMHVTEQMRAIIEFCALEPILALR